MCVHNVYYQVNDFGSLVGLTSLIQFFLSFLFDNLAYKKCILPERSSNEVIQETFQTFPPSRLYNFLGKETANTCIVF